MLRPNFRGALILAALVLLGVALFCGLIVWEMAQPEFWPVAPVPDQREGQEAPLGRGLCFAKTSTTPFTFRFSPGL